MDLCSHKVMFCAVIAQGINAGDVKKLQDAGIYTCNGLMMHTKKVNSDFGKKKSIYLCVPLGFLLY